VHWTGDGILQLTGYSEWERDQDADEQILTSTLKQRISNGDEGWKWAVEKFAVTDGGRALADAIRLGHAIAVSDGSYKDELGMAAYVLEGENGTNRIVAVLKVPGLSADQSPYRSELSGLYGIVVMVEVVCTHFEITSGAIEVGCDGLSALRKAFGQGSNFDPDIKDPDYDLLSAIRKALARSPAKWTWRHVLGHQDDDDGIEVLDRWATLNIEMDNLAKVH
jgi:hypothetical protein